MRNPRKQMLRCIKGCRKRFGRAEASRAYRYLNRESEQGFGGDEHEGSAQFGDAMSDVVVDAVLSPVLDTGLHAELPSPSNTDADLSGTVMCNSCSAYTSVISHQWDSAVCAMLI
jgi:hypothetical protein